MPDIVDKIIAEARSKEEKPFGLTYDEGLAILGYIQLCAAVVSSERALSILLLLSPDLIRSVNILHVADPKAAIAEVMADRLMKFCEENKP